MKFIPNLEEANSFLDKENQKYGEVFQEIPHDSWVHIWQAASGEKRFKVLRNRNFLIQLFRESHGVIRMTVNRTRLRELKRWDDGISWDEIQQIKSDMGYGHRDAVEIFPKDIDVVNVANMRHIWILTDEHNLKFVWRKI